MKLITAIIKQAGVRIAKPRVKKELVDRGKKFPLSTSEDLLFRRTVGAQLAVKIKQVASRSGYKRATPERRKKMIEAVRNQVTTIAKRRALAKKRRGLTFTAKDLRGSFG